MKTPQTFVFFGKSGCGKGTQAQLLIKKLESETPHKVLYIATGDRFRKFIEGDTYSAELTKEILESGDLFPEFLPIWFWAGMLIEGYSGKEHLVFDGISRRELEARILETALKFYKIERPNIIYMDVSDEWATERLLERNRGDDRKKEIRARLKWFKEHALLSIQYFEKLDHVNFVRINGEQSVEDVHEDIIAKTWLV